MTDNQKKLLRSGIYILFILCGIVAVVGYYFIYLNRDNNPHNAKTIGEIPLPMGYTRLPANEGSYATWLRSLPLKPRGTKVHLYNSTKPSNYQWLSAAVVDIPLLSDDEQCADVCMRMRAEYLYQTKQYDKIHFTALNGEQMSYTGGIDRKAFEKYMRKVFGGCNTTSMRESLKTRELKDLQIGDIFVYPHRKVAGKNRYGHAVMVADMAVNTRTGKKAFLLIEGNTPARDIHIVRNLNRFHNPWFYLNEEDEILRLNVFKFSRTDVRYF
ncbi:MAG: hypothetical protein IJ581_04775 [Paludibacteraceae bacterium]|nr:hypothetical protein [Paludibacteraceae bacterium]